MKSPGYSLSASIICANLLHLEKDLELLKKGKIDAIHFDVMDGLFVPRYGLPPEIVRYIDSAIDVPITIHMMVEDPEPYIDIFVESGADAIVAHIEPLKHVHRFLKKVKDKGVLVGVALNPGTPLSVLDYILDDIDLVTLMAINPGILGHKLIEQSYQKIEDLKKKLKDHPRIKIEIDGGVSFESGPKMIKVGADILVCGTSSIFKKDKKIENQIAEFRQILESSAFSSL